QARAGRLEPLSARGRRRRRRGRAIARGRRHAAQRGAARHRRRSGDRRGSVGQRDRAVQAARERLGTGTTVAALITSAAPAATSASAVSAPVSWERRGCSADTVVRALASGPHSTRWTPRGWPGTYGFSWWQPVSAGRSSIGRALDDAGASAKV